VLLSINSTLGAMRASLGRSPRLLWLAWLASTFLVGCATATTVERPVQAKAPAPPVVVLPPLASPLPAPVEDLYTPDEALRDALSSPWQHVGTGRWPGINRMYACAFRNERVLVVNVYCSTTDVRAFRVDVYSPKRGRVRIYAEASGPILKRLREQYFTFMAESEPPPGPEVQLAPLALTMSFAELRSYDEQRYRAYLPACFGGREHQRAHGACVGALAKRGSEWASQNRSFLDRANGDWYRVVREMRVLAARYGKDPKSRSRRTAGLDSALGLSGTAVRAK
jgi:hypothetical protein